jgi:hypothetical protein
LHRESGLSHAGASGDRGDHRALRELLALPEQDRVQRRQLIKAPGEGRHRRR